MPILKQAVAGALALAAATTPMRAQTPAADLRTTLNATLAEHVYLAAAATGAALGGRTDEFKRAAGALDANSVALSQAIGSVYGPEAEVAFLELWRSHIGFFVDYTTALGKGDRAGQEAAVAHLTGYADDFAAFLSSANPNLPKAAVSDLVRSHVLTLKAVVDAQQRRDWAGAYGRLREAAAHMRMIGDPVAGAIAKQFPEKFAMR
jgi:hypothetical protein